MFLHNIIPPKRYSFLTEYGYHNMQCIIYQQFDGNLMRLNPVNKLKKCNKNLTHFSRDFKNKFNLHNELHISVRLLQSIIIVTKHKS